MSKASFFIPKNSANLTQLNFDDVDKKTENSEKDEMGQNHNEEGSLINIENHEDLEKSKETEKEEESSELTPPPSQKSIKDKYAEDQEDKNNILSIQLENWMCSGFPFNFSKYIF